MSHIRIQRFGSGHGQNDRSQRQKGEPAVEHKEVDRMVRIERPQDGRRLDDLPRAERRNHRKIHNHDRREQRTNFCGATLLQHKQKHQQPQGDRDNILLKPCIDDRQTFNRRQNRNRRRDHAVAVKQRRSEHAQKQRDPAIFGFAQLARYQRNQSQRPALPFVVSAHQDGDILDRNNQRHRPENQADHTKDMRLVQRQRMWADEGLTEGVERAGADIAENDSDRPDGERSLRRAMAFTPGRRLVCWRCCCLAHRLWISRGGAIFPTDTALRVAPPSTDCSRPQHSSLRLCRRSSGASRNQGIKRLQPQL